MGAQQEDIVTFLNSYPQGVGIKELLEGLSPAPSKRSLQRWLQMLVNDGRVAKRGKGRNTVYALAPQSSPRVSLDADYEDNLYERYIPLSEESREILLYVRQPLGARKPVGFSQDLIDRYVPGQTWYLNQVIRKRLKQIAQTGFESRPAGTYGRTILDRLLVDLSWASSRLEGNTYTRLDTQRLIEMGQLAEGRDAIEAQMILNHKRAVELLVDDAEEIGFNRYTFLNLHGALSENLMRDPSSGGRLRARGVEIGQSVYQPTNVPQLIEEVFDELLSKADLIPDPFEQALFIMVHIPHLQPFEDVNKRVARLGANISLIRENLCPLTFIDVPERALVDAVLGVYEMNRIDLMRDVFVWSYERSTQQYLKITGSLASPDPIRLKYRDKLHEIIRTVVKALEIPAREAVRTYADKNVPDGDRGLFVELVTDELMRLHEGVIARYGIRPSEYERWREARSPRCVTKLSRR